VWIKRVFGFCGELWWFVVIFRLFRDCFRFGVLFLPGVGSRKGGFWLQKRGENVVIRVVNVFFRW
jgi:hypothetical protein